MKLLNDLLNKRVEETVSEQSSVQQWHPAIATYIHEVDIYLSGSVPMEVREHLRYETAFWLEREARDLIIEGMTPDAASEQAVLMHGDPKELAAKMVEDYFECELDSVVANGLGRANSVAGGIFGLANVAYLIFLQMRVYLPVTSPIETGLSPARAREIFPEPLPYPDFSWQFFVAVGYPLLAPIFAGWLCGRLIPGTGAPGAVYRVMALIVISALLLGALLLPDRTGVFYAVFLALYWLPVGCLSAHLSSSLLRRSRRRKVEGNGSNPSPSQFTQEVIP